MVLIVDTPYLVYVDSQEWDALSTTCSSPCPDYGQGIKNSFLRRS
jgi:hypothetical protein